MQKTVIALSNLFSIRNVILTLEIKTQKRVGTDKTRFYTVEMILMSQANPTEMA